MVGSIIPLMPHRITLLLLGLLAAAPSASAGFKLAAMSLPPELAQSERLPVHGRQGWKRLETLRFGEFTVRDVQRSLTKGSSLQILMYEGAKARQSYGFTVADRTGDAWRGEAETNVRRRALDVGLEIELRNKSGFGARLRPAARPDEAWLLKLEETRERPLQGSLSAGTRTVAVRGINRLAGTFFVSGETTGYVFELAGRPVAAVEVINDGAVWFSPGLPEDYRGAVTAAISSLLLFEELRKTLPE